ncbi:MAG: T9SS type A sorting domain-containing protein [Flavobacterium sp.]|nr:MAG: T9SS type A sorting domain-containing protein [Flavobacterium sp.]
MKKIYLALALLLALFGRAQVVINELDSDSPGTDDREFVELKSDTPNFSLDGYVLVFFNGSSSSSTGNRSYYVIDLDGLTTDINGIILIGSNSVSPVPAKLVPVSVIQNGADGVAIYSGSASDFPNNSMATDLNLIDALVYGTSDPDATGLMSLLGVSSQIDENVNSLGTTQSIQRKPDGTYEVKLPTPGANNDGSGFVFNGLRMDVTQNVFNEGDTFTISFSSQVAVSSALNFSISLNNGSFVFTDYSGQLSITIPVGSSSASTSITFIDDSVDDGDELAIIHFGNLPQGYNRLNDNVEIRVIDNDFTMQPWGTPLNPTYGIVSSTAPQGYYDSLEGKSGSQLKQAIQDIIADPAVVHAQNYGDIEQILKAADQSPLNSNQVWLMYVEQPRAKYKFQTTSSNVGSWNREHIYPQSRGGFADGTSSQADGINTWLPTNADDLLAGHGDAHHIRAEDGPENTSRSNRDYGSDYNGPAANQGSWKGDVARSLFYMAVRYNALSLVNGNPPDSTVGQLGDLASLLDWNHTDPADDFEMNRNNVIYTWQVNRNPFIDYPDLADYIWGANAGQTWHANLSAGQQTLSAVAVYPNPAHDMITITGISGGGQMEIYTVTGSKVLIASINSASTIPLNLGAGMYFVRVSSDVGTTVKKLIIK